MTGVVRAAGGVVWREQNGRVEVLIVHRPRYDDWSFPKGKAEDGESDEDCARREVEEETGVRPRLISELPGASYSDHKGRPKIVRYWLMQSEGGTFAPSDEVDEIRWLPPTDAVGVLSREHDRELARLVPDDPRPLLDGPSD